MPFGGVGGGGGGSLGDLHWNISLKSPGANQAAAQFTAALKRMDLTLKGVNQTMRQVAASQARFRRESKKQKTAVEKVGAAWKKLQARLRQFLVIVGSFIVLRRWIRVFTEFETAMAEVSTIAGESIVKMEKLREGVLDLAKAMPQSAKDLGSGLYQVISAGVTETADALIVLRASAVAATAGLTDTRTAVDAVTTVLNAYQRSASEASAVTDVLFKTVELGKVTFPELAQNIGNVATSAALAGVSIQEVGASIATLTKFGIKAAEATTSLNRLFLTLTSKSKEQTAAFEAMGIEFNVATVRSKGFVGLLQELNKLTDEQIDQLAELFPNIRAARAAFVLAGKGTAEYVKILGKTHAAQGAAQRAADKMNATLTNQARILAGNISILFQRLANKILPGVVKALESVNDLFLSGTEKSIRRAERLGLTLRKADLQRRQALEENLKLIGKIDKEFKKTYHDASKNARSYWRAQARIFGQLAAMVATVQQGGLDVRALKTAREELKRIEDTHERFKQALKGEISLRGEVLRLEREAALIADKQATVSSAESRVMEARLEEIEQELRILYEAFTLQQDKLALQLENARLQDVNYQTQVRELHLQEKLLQALKDNGASEERILEVRERIAELSLVKDIREATDGARSMAVVLGDTYSRFIEARDSLVQQQALVTGIEGAISKVGDKVIEVREDVSRTTDEREIELAQLNRAKADLLVLLTYHETILEYMRKQQNLREDAIEDQAALNKLTDDQVTFLRKLRAMALKEMGELDVLQVMNFDEAVRGFAEAFEIELSGAATDPFGKIGADWMEAIEEGAVKKLGETKARKVFAFFETLWQKWVVEFDASEKLVDRINSAMAGLGTQTLGEKIIAPIRKLREEFEELKAAMTDEKIAEVEQLFRDWETAARQAELDKVLEKFNKQLAEFTSTAAVTTLAEFEKQITEIESTVSNLSPEYIKARDALREWLKSQIELEKHAKVLEDIQDALSLEELRIEAAGMGEEEARQARITLYEEKINEIKQDRLAIEANEKLNAEHRQEALDENERALLEQIIALNDILGIKSDTLKIEKDQLAILRRQLRNMQAMVGLINQAFEGMVSLLEATGAIGPEFAKAANGIRQMVTGVMTLTTHLDVLEETQQHIAELEETVRRLGDELDQGVDSAKELNEALKQLEAAKGLSFEAMGGLLSGGLGLLGGAAALGTTIAGLFGPSPEEEERRRIMKANNEAIKRLIESMNQLRGTFDVSGAVFAGIPAAIDDWVSTFSATGGPLKYGFDPDYLRRQLAEFGLTVGDIERAAKELGIELGELGSAGYAQGLQDLLKAIEEAKLAFIGFPDTLEGVMRQASLTTQLYDLEDPALQAAARLAGLAGAGAEFTAWLDNMAAQGRDAVDALAEWQAGLLAMLQTFGDDVLKIPALADLFALDLTTTEGRAQAEQLIRELFRQFQLGELDIAELGFTTPQEFLDFIAGFEGLLDQMDEAAETMGETQDVRRQVSITELQANQLLAYQATQTEILRRMEGVLQQIRDSLGLGAAFVPIEPPPMPISSDELANWPDFQRMLDAFESGAPSIEVDMTIEQILIEGGIDTEEQARTFATTASDELRRQLGEAYKKNRRLKGLIE
jgi:TP901 family phage tail tape measure protein